MLLRPVLVTNRMIEVYRYSAIAVWICAFFALPVSGQDPAGDRAVLPPVEGNVSLAEGQVELHVADTPLATVLRMLSVQGQKNIIATPTVQGVVTADFYDVSFDEALRAILASNDCSYVERDNFIYVYTLSEMDVLSNEESPIRTQLFQLNYVRAADIVPIVEPLLSPEGKIATPPEAEVGISTDEGGLGGGGGSGGRGAGGTGGDSYTNADFVVVYDYPRNIQEISKIIGQIDARPTQVLIEATILRARLTNDNALGVDFSLVGGVDLELLGGASVGVQNLTLGQLPTSRFERFNSNLSTDFASNVPNGGVSFGVIKDHVAVFIRALEQITDTSVIANPKILALNKQSGNVIVGRRDGYITTTVTQTQAIQKVEFLETGTQLTFRPFIGTDGYVRIELHPKDSVGGLTAAQLPFEQTTEVTTNVIVRDGHTILIGGLFREVGTDSRSQVPFLGNIPTLGNLFRSRNDQLDREEVIILLTVYIVKDDNFYAEQSRKHLEDIERLRIGLRAGMMSHGRERLAQMYYQKSLDALEAHDIEKALWSVDMSVHNYSRFTSALKLREEIQQVREWEEDGSIIRTFADDLIDLERKRPRRNFNRPPMPKFEDFNVEPAEGQEDENEDGDK